MSGLLDKGEALLNHFIETIAVMMVTSCVIPVVILVFLLWLVKVLFGNTGQRAKRRAKEDLRQSWKEKRNSREINEKQSVMEKSAGRPAFCFDQLGTGGFLKIPRPQLICRTGERLWKERLRRRGGCRIIEG